jgi:hypothetical protein
MLDNAEQVPRYFFFGATSCVPATLFETAGAEITVDDIEELFKDDRIKMLSEMMNWPGVLSDDPVVLALDMDAAPCLPHTTMAPAWFESQRWQSLFVWFVAQELLLY